MLGEIFEVATKPAEDTLEALGLVMDPEHPTRDAPALTL